MSDIYQHFRKDEEPFIDKALEWKQTAADQYRMKLTDFLDPREQVILNSLVGQSDEVKLAFFGGFPEAERKRAVFYPEYVEPSAEDFQLQAYEVLYPQKFASIEHRELLGSLMGIGLKRQKFGDLIFADGTWQFVCSEEVADFVFSQLGQIGKVKVSLEKIPLSKLKVPEQAVEIRDDTVSSLRLDAVCSAVSRQSRQKAQVLVKNGLVKVNWKVIEDPSYTLLEGDMLSVRGFGRFRLKNIDGKTKKGKWRLSFELQK
ncbi:MULTISPECIES: YlmH family RNA-binding protein [Bacillus]|uniref:YlmH family RNA-binding protein n=1 Tax=Bacillus TaxID=1386 RepID=UPI000406531C|nr:MULTISPECIES: RNA-binding protein [Bacillus]QHZ46725.1 RNA-binding protein [Bacillus sp. NSP9.1]WFA06856.1 RNA-binding protein [Bacillus sp. HSf4]